MNLADRHQNVPLQSCRALFDIQLSHGDYEYRRHVQKHEDGSVNEFGVAVQNKDGKWFGGEPRVAEVDALTQDATDAREHGLPMPTRESTTTKRRQKRVGGKSTVTKVDEQQDVDQLESEEEKRDESQGVEVSEGSEGEEG